MNSIINDLKIRIIAKILIFEFMIIIKIDNHLNIKNENGGILAIFINKNVKDKLGRDNIMEGM